MSDAAPPLWVRKLELPSGAWRCLVGLWGFARYTEDGPAKIWPSRATIAEHTGQKPATVAKQLRALAELGWIRRMEGTEILLAWKTPLPAEATPRRPRSRTRRPESPTTTVAPPTTGVTPPTTTVAAPRRPQSPQTFQGTSKELPKNVPSTRADERDQRAFALVADEPDELTRLISEHERLRLDALATNGRRRTKLPGASSKPGKALRARARKALHELGLPKCLELLEWQAKRWREDPGQLTYSTDSVWSPGSVRHALARMSEGPRTRQGSGQRTGWEVGANDDDNIAPLLPAGEDPFDCERLTATRRVC